MVSLMLILNDSELILKILLTRFIIENKETIIDNTESIYILDCHCNPNFSNSLDNKY